jgi:hypothetical protein
MRLAVTDGDSPAVTLYRSLRPAEYGGSILYTLSALATFPRSLPFGHEVDRRVIPASVQELEAIAPERYRTPLLVRITSSLFTTSRHHDILRRRTQGHMPVGRRLLAGEGPAGNGLHPRPARPLVSGPRTVSHAVRRPRDARGGVPAADRALPAERDAGHRSQLGFACKRTHLAMGTKL